MLQSPWMWLALCAALAALALLLGGLGPRLAPPLEVTVCNRTAAEPLEQVAVQLVPSSPDLPPVLLGQLKPDECRTAQLPLRGEESVRLTYQLEGAEHVVHDPAIGYVEPGFHYFTEVRGAGESESGLEHFWDPDRRVIGLGWSILVSLVGAAAALLCAAGVAGWRLVRMLSSTRAG